MYRLLSIKQYRYLEFQDHVEYGNVQFEEFEYGKTIQWDDYVGKWPEDRITELPYYHPYWRRQVRLVQSQRAEYLNRKIKELEGKPKHAREVENFRKELKNIEG